MNKIFIDTLFVVALVNHRDQHHHCASELADQYQAHALLTTSGVLLEIGNALARNFKKQSIEIIEEFHSSKEVEIIHITPRLMNQAFELYRKYQDKEWGLVDCVSFVVMQHNNIDNALTFDQHFVQAGFKALMREC